MISKQKRPRKKSIKRYPSVYHEHAASIYAHHSHPFELSESNRCVLHRLGLNEEKLLDCVIRYYGKRHTREAQLSRIELLLQTKGLDPNETGVQWKFHNGLDQFLVNRDHYAHFLNEIRMKKEMPPIWQDSVGDFFKHSKCQARGLNSHSEQDFVNAGFLIPEGINYFCSIATGEEKESLSGLSPYPQPGPSPYVSHHNPQASLSDIKTFSLEQIVENAFSLPNYPLPHHPPHPVPLPYHLQTVSVDNDETFHFEGEEHDNITHDGIPNYPPVPCVPLTEIGSVYE